MALTEILFYQIKNIKILDTDSLYISPHPKHRMNVLNNMILQHKQPGGYPLRDLWDLGYQIMKILEKQLFNK